MHIFSEDFLRTAQNTMSEVVEELRSFGERGMASCKITIKTIHDFTHSVTDVPCGREGESHNTIREHHNNCNILL